MINKEKEVIILWNRKGNNFMYENLKVLAEPVRYIGGSNSAINALLANGEELKYLMKTVIGQDPNSTTANWDKLIAEYWYSYSVGIPSNGKKLQIGFSYDLTDPDRKDYISKLVGDKKDITNDEALAEYCETKIPEHHKYRYGVPLNIDDYLLYRYCLNYRDVANDASPETISKSPNIRFYIWSNAEEQKVKRAAYKITFEAHKKLMDVISKPELVDNLVYMIVDNKASIADVYPTTEDKHSFLLEYCKSNPTGFLSIASDNKITTKVMIERMVEKGILKRLTNSQIVIDSNDPEMIIGHNMEEAVTFFNSTADSTKVRIAEYKAKLGK